MYVVQIVKPVLVIFLFMILGCIGMIGLFRLRLHCSLHIYSLKLLSQEHYHGSVTVTSVLIPIDYNVEQQPRDRNI